MSRYQKSIRQLERAERTIPLGAQTFSKSKTQYPVGISPHFAVKAKGPYIWDIDGNKYIDLVSSLASITLGYGDRELERAVKKQIRSGTIFSLSSPLEAEVAELIVDMVPCAEMVRFGKNGTDATSAAIRLARAYTGKKHILVCGYHGWQDWFIGSTTMNKGVPDEVSSLTHNFPFNNIEFLRELLLKFEDDVAGIIMEPMNSAWPTAGYLEQVKQLAESSGSLLIFDETITGFRFSKGGAQELFGVTPHLATFGKGLANGFPLSAIVGRRDIMMEMNNIFFSGTFGGELLSLTAAKTVLQRHATENVCGSLADIGNSLSQSVENLIKKHNLSNFISLSGHNSWKFINWKSNYNASSDELKTFFIQEMFARGVLILGTHNVSLSHTSKVVSSIVSTYSEVLNLLSDLIKGGNFKESLKTEPILPLFKVR